MQESNLCAHTSSFAFVHLHFGAVMECRGPFYAWMEVANARGVFFGVALTPRCDAGQACGADTAVTGAVPGAITTTATGTPCAMASAGTMPLYVFRSMCIRKMM